MTDKSDEIRLQVVLQNAVTAYTKKYGVSIRQACEDLNIRHAFYLNVQIANRKRDAVSNLGDLQEA